MNPPRHGGVIGQPTCSLSSGLIESCLLLPRSYVRLISLTMRGRRLHEHMHGLGTSGRGLSW